MTVSGAYSAVAETVGLKPKQIRDAMEALMTLAAKQLMSVGSFKFVGALNLKLKRRSPELAKGDSESAR